MVDSKPPKICHIRRISTCRRKKFSKAGYQLNFDEELAAKKIQLKFGLTAKNLHSNC